MTVHNRVFASSSKSWEALCDEASAFASEVGPEKLINRLTLFNFVHLGLAPLPMLLRARGRLRRLRSAARLRPQALLLDSCARDRNDRRIAVGGPDAAHPEVSPRAASQRVRTVAVE